MAAAARLRADADLNVDVTDLSDDQVADVVVEWVRKSL